MSSSLEVGLFGGTFNPIHNAHLEVAQNAINQFGFEKVIFIPSKLPPHKQAKKIPAPEIRYQMVQLAIQPNPKFDISSIELNREGPSYTIDTVKEYKKRVDDLAFIVGADNLSEIETWKSPHQLLECCPFIVAPRGGVGKDHFQGDIFKGKDIRFLDMAEIELSSTEIRQRYKQGLAVDNLLPQAVKNYIEEQQLYRSVSSNV